VIRFWSTLWQENSRVQDSDLGASGRQLPDGTSELVFIFRHVEQPRQPFGHFHLKVSFRMSRTKQRKSPRQSRSPAYFTPFPHEVTKDEYDDFPRRKRAFHEVFAVRGNV
jgi:hypothetical protein